MSPPGPVIPHSRPTVGDEEAQAAAQVLRSGHLAQGEVVRRFERAMAAYLGRRDGVATSSGTAALHLALLALGVGPGDEVLMPSYTCVALWHAVTYVGAVPRLADVDLVTFNLSPADAARRITPRVRALIVPHMFGLAADLDPLLALGVPVIEDCAQALGATYRGERVGRRGAVTVCSFYATKVITTGEGGMLLADDEAILSRARDLRDYDGRRAYRVRYNYKMTDVQAAVGLAQLRRLPHLLARRRAIAATYAARLADLPLLLPASPPGYGHIFYRYVLRTDDPGRLRHRLAHRGVEAKPPVGEPLHRYTGEVACPQAEVVARTALSVPLYPSLSDGEVDHVAAAVADAVRAPEDTAWPRPLLVSGSR